MDFSSRGRLARHELNGAQCPARGQSATREGWRETQVATAPPPQSQQCATRAISRDRMRAVPPTAATVEKLEAAAASGSRASEAVQRGGRSAAASCDPLARRTAGQTRTRSGDVDLCRCHRNRAGPRFGARAGGGIGAAQWIAAAGPAGPPAGEPYVRRHRFRRLRGAVIALAKRTSRARGAASRATSHRRVGLRAARAAGPLSPPTGVARGDDYRPDPVLT